MQDLLKKPNFYFIAAPIIAGIWLLLCWGVILQTANANWKSESEKDQKAQEQTTRILELDPERLEKKNKNGSSAEFDYTNVIDHFAKQYRINPGDYSLRVRQESKRGGQRSRNATLSIKSIDVVKLSKFLSSMQMQWPDLQCNTVKLTNTNAGPDAWKTEVVMVYYY